MSRNLWTLATIAAMAVGTTAAATRSSHLELDDAPATRRAQRPHAPRKTVHVSSLLSAQSLTPVTTQVPKAKALPTRVARTNEKKSPDTGVAPNRVQRRRG